MKKHNAIKVVLITMLVFAILTWILPAAYYSSEFVDQGRVQMGLFDLFSYPMTSLSYFGYIAMYMIMVGGFYGILYKIPAYRSFLDKIASKCQSKGLVVISFTMAVLAILTSVCGLQLGLVLFYPFIISVILLMGYDKIVAAMTVVGSTMIGIAGSTYAYENVAVINSVLGGKLTDDIYLKVAILVIGVTLLIINMVLYNKGTNTVSKKSSLAEKKAESKVEEVKEEKKEKDTVKKSTKKTSKSSSKSTKKTAGTSTKKSSKNTKSSSNGKKTTSKSSRKDNKAATKGEGVIVIKESLEEVDENYLVPTVTSNVHKVWPMVCAFIMLFIVLVLAFIPWSNTFTLDVMEKATSAVNEFKLFGFPLFSKILGTFNTFGAWMITDMFLVMAFIIVVLTVIYKVKIDDIFDGFANGAKKALGPAIIALLIYSILVLVTYHPFQLTIYKFIMDFTNGFNVFTTSLVAILSSIFNGDPVYAFQSALPYIAGVITNSDVYPIIAVIFQSIYGVTMLIAPTSVVLMITLSYLGISYKDWFKSIWKLLVELFVILLIIFTVLVLI